MLSVKNLEKRSTTDTSRQISKYIISENNPNVILKSNFHNNYQPKIVDNESLKYPIYEHRWKMLQNIKNIAINNNRNFPSLGIIKQEKEVDEISTTSSKTNTNFTGERYLSTYSSIFPEW